MEMSSIKVDYVLKLTTCYMLTGRVTGQGNGYVRNALRREILLERFARQSKTLCERKTVRWLQPQLQPVLRVRQQHSFVEGR